MNDDDAHESAAARCRRIPSCAGSLSSVSPRIRRTVARAVIPSWNSTGNVQSTRGRQPERREAVGRERDVARQCRLQPSRRPRVVGHALAEVMAGAISPSHRRACPAS